MENKDIVMWIDEWNAVQSSEMKPIYDVEAAWTGLLMN